MNTPSSVNHAMNDVKDALRETEDLLEQAASATAEQASSLYARVARNLGQTKTRLVEMESQAVDKARYAAKATDTYVHDHPWQAIGVGVAVGVLLGMLISRR